MSLRLLLLPLLLVPLTTLAASRTYDPDAARLKVSEVAVVQRAEALRTQMYPEWSGEAFDPYLQRRPSFMASPFSPPPGLVRVRAQMQHAASVAGEVEAMHVFEEDSLRWNHIVTSVDQLATDSHTAFVSRAHGRRLDKEVARRFIESLDPWRVLFSSQEVSRFLSDRTGIAAAISGKDLGWIDRVATQARQVQATVIQDSIDRMALAPTDGSLPAECSRVRSWTLKPERFVRPDRLESQRLSGFCDSLASRLVPMKEGSSPAKAIEDLTQEYKRMSDQLAKPLTTEHYLSFIQARLAVLDPHSAYVPAAAKSDFAARMAAAYVGLGVHVSFSSGVASFARVNESGPAYEAGIRQGDQLLAIGLAPDQVSPVSSLTADQVLSMMSGVEGGTVWLKIKDGAGAEVEKVVRRRRIELAGERVRTNRLEATAERAGMLHIRVSSFYKDASNPDRPGGSTTADVRRALEQAQEGDWVVLDLRGNGGGLLDEALGVAGLFLSSGTVVQVEQPSGQNLGLAARPGRVWSGRLALLVDRATGSASEIVAGALQDYQRAVILGERTFGKGTAQSLFDLDSWAGAPGPVYGQVNLTTMRFFRPSGISTQLNGVEPDVAFLPQHGGGRELALDLAMRPTRLQSAANLPSVSQERAACLAQATRQAVQTWNGGAWASDWNVALEEIHTRPIRLDARKQFIDDRIAVRERLNSTLASLPGGDAPLLVTLSVLPTLQSCLSPPVSEP